MRKDIEFKTEDGVALRGWLYLPDRASGRVPTIVMAHGFSAVKENYLDKYGEVWHFDVQDGAFVHRDSQSGTPALVFAVVPAKILGFRRGDHPGQTRWTVQSAQDWTL